ncbi:large conductance mechanosensitive channel protein MscL [Frankia nepalensis]|uniref:large conductance mechanosensitive channel protein MscL n=1 Tax=Frankia nepalensis TaxID=1836974 RepID=UPI0038995AA7
MIGDAVVAAKAVRSPLVGFRQFITRGNVVDLAVAVVVGTAFTAVVQSLVKNIFTPLIAAIFGKPDFSSLTFHVHHSVFHYGTFLNDVITFLSVAAVIYFVVVFPLARFNELRRRGQTDEVEAPSISDEARLLTEIRDLLAAGVGGGQLPAQAETRAGADGAPPPSD